MNKSTSELKVEEASAALRRYDLEGLEAACRLYAYATMDPKLAARALAGWAEALGHLSWQRRLRGQPCEEEAAAALRLADTATAREPRSAHCQRGLAAALMNFPDQHERRRAAAVRAVELDPLDAANWYERWKAFGSSIDDGAIRRALELDSRHFGAVHDLGVALSEAGRNEQAARLLATAVSLSPGNMVARWNLSAVLSRAGRDAEADCILAEASQRAPQDPLFQDVVISRASAATAARTGAACP